MLFSNGICAIETECSLFNTMVQCHYQQLLAHTVSTPKQCERCNEGLVFHPLHLEIKTVFSVFNRLERCC